MADGNITSSTNLSSTSSSSSSSSLPQQQQQHQQGGKLTNRTLDGKLICKHTNVIQRTTSESLRLGGGDHILAAAGGDGGVGGGGGVSVGGLAAIAALQQQQQPLPPPSSNLNNNINNSSSSSLAASAAARKSKTSSFQITSVTVGTRMSADNGDDSADDLDESHTDDNSRITDLENETPSFSEDTSFSKEDVFFSSHALGTAPVIPTSAQYGLAIVQPENLGGTDVPQQINDVHVSVTDDGINIVGAPNSKNDNPDLKDLNQRNERFKVVKIESTEPFKRGRWMCMDYLDHTTSQPTQSPQGPMIRDGGGGGAAITMDSGVGMSENHIDFENPIGAADSPQKTVQTDIHLQNLINTNLLSGQSAPGGGYPTSASTSPGQSLIQPMLGELNSNIAIASHAQTMSHPIVNMPNIVAAAQQPAQSMPQQQLQQIISTNVEQAAIPHPNIVQGQSQPAQFFANPAHHPHHHHHHHSPHPHHHSHHHPAQHQGQTLPAGALHGLIAQSNQNVGAVGAAVVAAGGGGQAMSMGHIPISQPQIVDLNNMIPINPAANFPTQNASQTQIPQTILLTDNYAAQSSGPVTNVIVGAGPNPLPTVENQNFIAGNVAIVASTAAVPVAVIPTAVTAAVGQVSSNVSQSPIGLSLQNSVNAVVNSVVGSMNVNIDELAIGNKVNVLSPTAAAAVTAGTAGTVPTAAVAVGDISVMQTMLQQQQQQPSSSGSTGSDSVVIEGATATTTNTDNGVGDDQQNAEDSERIIYNVNDTAEILLKRNPSYASSIKLLASVSGLALALKNNHHPKSQNVISTPRSHYLKNQRPTRTVVTENIYNPTRRESNVYTNLALGNCMENLMKNTTSQVLPKQMCRIHVENASDTCGVCVAATNTTTSSAHNIPHKNVQTILREDGIQIPTTQNQWTGEAHSLPNKMNISPPSGRYSSMNNYNSNNQSPGQMNMTPSTSPSFGSSYLEVYNGGSGKVSRAVSPQPYLSSSGGSTTAGDYSASGTSAVAIDNKIEQAMDLVKSHLMFAVREEVEVLKEKIAELMDRINQLEVENTILKANATQETLTQLTTTATTVAPTTKSPQNPTNGPIS